jgi:hypothetical protein
MFLLLTTASVKRLEPGFSRNVRMSQRSNGTRLWTASGFAAPVSMIEKTKHVVKWG